MATEATISGNEPKVEFDAAQQERVNELIREAMGRAGGEARQEAATVKTQLTTIQTELEQTKRDLAAAKTPGQKKEAQGDIERLTAEIAEIRNAHATVAQERDRLQAVAQQKEQEVQVVKQRELDTRKEIALSTAASKIQPYEVDEVVRATKDNVIWDEAKSTWVVIDPRTNQPRLNSGLYPMSLDEYYVEFAASKPYMIRGSVKTGTGTTESGRFDVANNGKYTVEQIFGPNSSGKLANDLNKKDPAEYQRLRQVAIDNGILFGKRSNS